MGRFFNGSSDYIDCGSGVNSPAAVTMSCWVNATSLTNAYQAVFSRVDSGPKGYQLFIKSTGKLASYVIAGATVDYDGTGSHTLTTGTWYHLAATYDSVNGLIGYVNGASDGTAAANGTLLTSTGTLQFSNDFNNGGRQFNGIIADCAQWNVALSSSQIAQLAAGYRPVDVNSGNLDGWWPLSGYSSPEPDISGHNNNGTLHGTSQAPMPPSISRGGRGFNTTFGGGTSDIITTSYTTVPTQYSLSCWVNPRILATNADSAFVCFANGVAGGSNIFAFYIDHSQGDSMSLIYQASGGGQIKLNSVISTMVGRWQHVGIAHNWGGSPSAQIYVNGVGSLVGTPSAGLAPTGGPYDWLLGSQQSGEAATLDGMIADCAIWNTTLSASQMQQLADGVRPGSVQAANLQGWWPLDGFSNTTEPDRSGNSFNATLTGTHPILGPPQLWRLSA